MTRVSARQLILCLAASFALASVSPVFAQAPSGAPPQQQQPRKPPPRKKESRKAQPRKEQPRAEQPKKQEAPREVTVTFRGACGAGWRDSADRSELCERSQRPVCYSNGGCQCETESNCR